MLEKYGNDWFVWISNQNDEEYKFILETVPKIIIDTRVDVVKLDLSDASNGIGTPKVVCSR